MYLQALCSLYFFCLKYLTEPSCLANFQWCCPWTGSTKTRLGEDFALWCSYCVMDFVSCYQPLSQPLHTSGTSFIHLVLTGAIILSRGKNSKENLVGPGEILEENWYANCRELSFLAWKWLMDWLMMMANILDVGNFCGETGLHLFSVQKGWNISTFELLCCLQFWLK